MSNFDVTFLFLSRPSSNASIEMSRLLDVLIEAGLNCKIATNPTELVLGTPHENSQLIIIDGTDDSEFNVYELAAILRCSRNTVVALLVDDRSTSHIRGLHSGAHVCLPLVLGAAMLGIRLLDAIKHATTKRIPPPVVTVMPRTGRDSKSARPKSMARHTTELQMTSEEHAMWNLKGAGWQLISPTGVQIKLTNTERQLMERFFSAPGVTVPHEEFYQTSIRAQNVSTAISRLRRKCQARGLNLPIHADHGKGYVFAGQCKLAENKHSFKY